MVATPQQDDNFLVDVQTTETKAEDMINKQRAKQRKDLEKLRQDKEAQLKKDLETAKEKGKKELEKGSIAARVKYEDQVQKGQSDADGLISSKTGLLGKVVPDAYKFLLESL